MLEKLKDHYSATVTCVQLKKNLFDQACNDSKMIFVKIKHS